MKTLWPLPLDQMDEDSGEEVDLSKYDLVGNEEEEEEDDEDGDLSKYDLEADVDEAEG